MPRPRLPAALVAALLASAVLVFATRTLAPAPDEPWLLRWLRTMAAHPVRTTLALALLGAGLAGPRRAPEAVDPAAAPRAGGEEELG